MIVRILGILVGLFFVVGSVMMFYIGQEGLLAQVGLFVVGLIFATYGFVGPKIMGKFMPSAVKEVGGESLPKESQHESH